MKTYHGTATDGAVTVDVDGYPVGPLDYRLDLINNSPTGFAWGYEGSGPAQLALALCADALDSDEHALQIYQEFKRRVVAGLPQSEDWIVSDTVVRAICAPLLGPGGDVRYDQDRLPHQPDRARGVREHAAIAAVQPDDRGEAQPRA